MEVLILGLILIGSLFFIGRRFKKAIKEGEPCDFCDSKKSCKQPLRDHL